MVGRAKGSGSYWSKLTPEERSAEMRRRQKKWSPDAKAKWGLTGTRKKGQAKQAAAEYKKGVARREADRIRSQKRRDAIKAAHSKSIPMSARPSKPGQIGRNGKSMRTQKERAAQQKRYAERSTLRAQGVPENKLPPILKLRSLDNAVVWAKNKGPAKRSSDGKKKADQRVYQARSNAKRDGKPQPPLPSRSLTPEEHAAAQREHASQANSAAVQ